MTCSVEAIANKFIQKALPDGVSHMKLQKIIYLAHEMHLKHTSMPLINEEPEVWQFGPIFSTLYHRLKNYKNAQINTLIEAETANIEIDNNAEKLVDKVWEQYKSYTGPSLSDLTHKAGTPWRRLAEQYDYSVPLGLRISNSLILECVNGHNASAC